MAHEEEHTRNYTNVVCTALCVVEGGVRRVWCLSHILSDTQCVDGAGHVRKKVRENKREKRQSQKEEREKMW